MSEGKVVAVCLSATAGVPKQTQDRIEIGRYGVEGDYHAGEYRTNGKGEREISRRHVTVVAEEALEAAGRALSVTIPQGGVGENVLVRGMGDLGDLTEEQVLRFSSGVELEVTGQNNPCKNLAVYHPQVPKELYGRRGLLTVVKNPGSVRPGDAVEIV
jgi:MOSC domain-containing protein YiiM